MTTVSYFSIPIANKAGEAAKVLTAILDAGINLTALWGYPLKGRNAILDVVPEDAAAFSKMARKHKLSAVKKTALYHDGADKPGAVLEHMAKLAAAGINVWAAQAICGGAGRYGTLLQLDPADLRKAKKVLGAS